MCVVIPYLGQTLFFFSPFSNYSEGNQTFYLIPALDEDMPEAAGGIHDLRDRINCNYLTCGTQ